MKTLHSEVFYYAIAVYALGAAAILILPSSSQQQATAAESATHGDSTGVTVEITKTSVRNAVSAQSSGFVFAGTPAKF